MPNRFYAALTGLILFMPVFLSAQNNTITIAGNPVVCYGDCAVYTANWSSPGGPPLTNATYQWTFTTINGQQFLGNAQSITLCFPPAGSGTLTVVASSTASGSSATATMQVTVLPFAPLQIISDNPAICEHDSLGGNPNDPNDPSNPDDPVCEKVCPNSTVTYSATGLFSGTQQQSLVWSVIGAESYTLNPPFGQSVTVQWGAPGTGSVMVKTDSANSTQCSGQASICVTIVEEPEAAFSTDPAPALAPPAPLQVCRGQTVWFDNQSLFADSYEWHFGDGVSSSQAFEPQHTYLAAGLYEVVLIARSACFCTDTARLFVEVLDADAPLLDCVGTVCPGEVVTYTAASACPDFNWTVSPNGVVLDGGGMADDSVTVQWVDGPDGVVSLFTPACAASACPFPAVTHVPILSDNAEISGAERVCPDEQGLYFIEPFGGTNFVWTLSSGGTITSGQGTNQVMIDWQNFANPGTTHWLSVVYDNCYLGCGGRDSIPVRIVSPFIITGPVEQCEGSSAVFTAKLVSPTQNLSCDWTMLAPDGSVAWTGLNTATANVSFTSGAGRYRLIAVPANPDQSCTDMAEWVVNVPAAPAAPTGIEGPALICTGQPLTYRVDGVAPSAPVQWTIQNGPGAPVTAGGTAVVVNWNATGPYWLTAQQISADGLGCVSDTVRLDVSTVGSLNLTGTSPACLNAPGSYSVPLLENVDYQWEILPADAGVVITGQGSNTIKVAWQTAGNHTLSVSVCGQTATFSVTVNPLPAPQVTAPAGLCPGNTTLVQTTVPFPSYAWKDIAGHLLGVDPSIDLGPGDYSVEVSDANGCPGTVEFGITSLPAPNFSISTANPTAFCNNSQFVTMQALTTADGDYEYEWFQNGVALGVNAPTYTTNQYGSYTAQATNQFGCSATAGPVAIVQDCSGPGGGGGVPGGGGPICPPGAVTLALATTPACDSFLFQAGGFDYLPGSAQWTFGQSGASIFGTAAGDAVSFVFQNAGQYVAVMLAIQQSTGATCWLLDSLNAEAVAQFDYLPGCPGEATDFQDISTFLPSSGITGWQWDFGDPASGANNTSTVRNASHVFADPGSYDISLTVTASSGCTSTAVENIKILPGPAITFSSPPSACLGNASEFSAVTGADATAVSWDFGDPASGTANNAGGNPAYHLYNTPGNYTVTATATNALGCSTVFTQNIAIGANGLSGVISPAGPLSICEGTTTTLTAPAGGVSYLWSDSSGTTGPSLTVGQAGAFTVTMTDANGCSFAPPPVVVNLTPGPDAIVKALLTNDLGQVYGVSYPTLNSCFGDDVTLQIFGAGSYTYSWSNSTTGTVNIFSQDHNNLLNEGTHIYTVTVTDATTGCTSVTDPFVVQVNPTPSGFSVSANGACAGASTLTYNGPQPPSWHIVWNTGATGPTLTAETGGTYFVQVINEFGCIGQSNVLNILPGPPDEAVPSGCHTRCRPDTLCLPAMPNVVGWQWFYNGAPVPGATGPDFVAQQSGTYWAALTDIYGCTAQSGDLVLDLFDGYGDIVGQVWSDVNGNGAIDPADTLVAGIPVNLWQNGTAAGNTQSGTGGDFSFIQILSTGYTVTVDTATLPPGWQIVIGLDSAALSGCNVQTDAALLLAPLCTDQVFDTLQLAACAGQSVVFNSTTIAAGDSQNFQFTTPDGCDSILTVVVNVLPASADTLNAQACPGSFFDFNGTMIPAGLSQEFTLQNYLGCDSVVTVIVAVLPTSTGMVNAQACPGEAFDFNGTMIPAGQSQAFTLQNYLGCDSVVTVNVAVLPTSTGTVNAQACPGEAFDYNGTMIPAGQSQAFTLQNYLGCDSVVTVNVAVLPTSTGTVNAQACPGESFDFNGTMIPAGQSQAFTLQNYLGCDSVVTVNVAVLPTSTGTVNAQACPGEAFDFNGTMIPAGQSQAFTLQNYLGCDSVVTVNVAVLPVSASTLNVGACAGESYDYNGTLIPAGQSQMFTLQNSLGCDSVVTVNVAAGTPSTFEFSAQICDGESFNFNGTLIPAGDTLQIVLDNYLGCDSTVTIVVSALPVSSSELEVGVCAGDTLFYAGEALLGGETRVFTLQNQLGCDSTVTVTTLAWPEAGFSLAMLPSCANAPTGLLSVVGLSGGAPPFEVSIDGSIFQDSLVFNALAPGDYTLSLQDANGCVFERDTTILQRAPLQLALADGLLPCDTSGVRLSPVIAGDSIALQLLWHNGATTPAVTLTEAGPVWVEATNLCETVRAEAAVNWAEIGGAASLFYVPNAVAPAAENTDNALFRPFFPEGLVVRDYIFRVYDRWGNWMWDAPGPEAGWESLFRTRDMKPGVYVWYLEATVDFCGRTLVLRDKGDVTVVR